MQLTLVLLLVYTQYCNTLIQACTLAEHEHIQVCGYIQSVYCCMLTPCMKYQHLCEVSTAIAKEDLLISKLGDRNRKGSC